LNSTKGELFDQLSDYQQIPFSKYTESQGNILLSLQQFQELCCVCVYLHKNYDDEAKNKKQSSDFTFFSTSDFSSSPLRCCYKALLACGASLRCYKGYSLTRQEREKHETWARTAVQREVVTLCIVLVITSISMESAGTILWQEYL
jgi:hypothetical protein